MRNKKVGVGEVRSGQSGNPNRRGQEKQTHASSEERFQLLARATNDAVWDWDLITNEVWWNEGVSTLFGYSEDEIHPDISWWQERLHPDERERVLSGADMILKHGAHSWSDEYRYRRADGSYAYVFDRGYVMHDENGCPVRMIGAMVDFTQRKQAEDALRENERLLQAIIDNSPLMIFIKNLDGRYLLCNPPLEKFCGRNRGQIIGFTDRDIFSPQEAARFQANDAKVLELGVPVEFEETVIRASGPHTSIVSKFPLRDAHGTIYAIGGVIADISERKRAADDLQKQKEILQTIFDHIPIMIRFLGKDGRVKLVNREWEHILGWRLKEIEEQNVDIYAELYPDPHERQAVLKSVAASTGEWKHYRPRVRDGRVLDTIWSLVRLSDGTSIGFGQDITERRRAETELLAVKDKLAAELADMTRLHEFSTRLLSSGELQRLLEEVLDAIMELQGADFGNVQLYNPESRALEIVAQRNFKQDFLDHFCKVDKGDSACGRALLQRRRVIIQDVRTDPEFQPHLEIAAAAGFRAVQSTPLFGRSGEPLGMLSTHFRQPHCPSERDLRLTDLYTIQAAQMIERQRAEQELRHSQEQLRALLSHSQSVREEERGRIARELHDEIGQALTGIKLSLETALRERKHGETSRLEQIVGVTNELIGRVRNLSLELRPAMLDDLGLLPALRWHLGRYTNQSKIKVEFKHSGLEGRRFKPEIETAAYRIVQEALTNVARHANVNTAEACVWADENVLCLRVTDSGEGFNLQAVSNKTTGGLSGMRERAAMLRGQLWIESSPRRGTLLNAKLPLD